MPDYYAVLQVSPRASPEVIRAAHRALCAIAHPDRGGKDRLAALINEAFAVLSDEKKRARYDEGLRRPVGKEIGNYRILDQIAEGGFGITYKAEHILTEEPVCIKHCSRISALDERLLLEEARAIWDLRHFSIPVMRDVLRFDDGSLGLVMSYIPGPTLEKIIEQNGSLDPVHVAWITERLLNALMYLHMHGVVHGDVKPGNIILQPENHSLVLVDFGLALVKPNSKSAAIGYTQCFAPPEEIAGRPIIPESDLYSLGMTMVYALNGGDVRRLERKSFPSSTPKPLVEFLRRLIGDDVLSRPHWGIENLCETIAEVRVASFGSRNSGMKHLKYSI